MMSNALSLALGRAAARAPGALAAAAGSAPSATSQPDAPVPPVVITLVAVGICVLAVWVFRRIANPSKLLLTSTPGRPNGLNLIHLLVALGAWAATVAALNTLVADRFAGEAKAKALLICSAIAQVMWIAAGLVIARRAFRHGLRRGLGLSARRWLYDGLRAVLGYLSVLPACVGLLVLMVHVTPPEHQHQHILLEYHRVMPPAWQAVVWLSALVLAPLAEEIFFRGLLQSLLRRYLRQPWIAVLVSAVCFTAIHAPYWHTMPSLFALAIALGYNYERTGRLFAPILIHCLFNAVNLAFTAS